MTPPAASGDRFVCRREGHVPAIKFTSMKASGVKVPETYWTVCVHCGKHMEFPIPNFIDVGASFLK